jgi:GMP synthase (glutamine-hydrolysing)
LNPNKPVIVNTHPGANPTYVGGLFDYLHARGLEPEVVDGYGDRNPLDSYPSHILLSGVPLNVDYSLAQPGTQDLVQRAFGWLQVSPCPVLGICYGHQILAQLFGGRVAALKWTVKEPRFPLDWQADPESGIFAQVEHLRVFVEHRDYVAKIPPGFRSLCRVGEVPYIMFNPDREMYGVQFVPEQSDERTKALLARFVRSG